MTQPNPRSLVNCIKLQLITIVNNNDLILKIHHKIMSLAKKAHSSLNLVTTDILDTPEKKLPTHNNNKNSK